MVKIACNPVAPNHGLLFFLQDFFLESVTPEKTQALADADEIIKKADLKKAANVCAIEAGSLTESK